MYRCNAMITYVKARVEISVNKSIDRSSPLDFDAENRRRYPRVTPRPRIGGKKILSRFRRLLSAPSERPARRRPRAIPRTSENRRERRAPASPRDATYDAIAPFDGRIRRRNPSVIFPLAATGSTLKIGERDLSAENGRDTSARVQA